MAGHVSMRRADVSRRLCDEPTRTERTILQHTGEGVYQERQLYGQSCSSSSSRPHRRSSRSSSLPTASCLLALNPRQVHSPCSGSPTATTPAFQPGPVAPSSSSSSSSRGRRHNLPCPPCYSSSPAAGTQAASSCLSHSPPRSTAMQPPSSPACYHQD